MSGKARRRPSWKAYKKGEDAFVIRLINEENDELFETIRIPKMGYVGRYLIRQYGYHGTEQFLKQKIIDFANDTLAMKEFING